MTNSQLTILCACILSTSVIDLAYRENEKAPARKLAREQREAAEFAEAVDRVKSALGWFQDECQSYLNKEDASSFKSVSSAWLGGVSSFCEKHPKAPLAGILTPYLADIQLALTAPDRATVTAAIQRTVQVRTQLGHIP